MFYLPFPTVLTRRGVRLYYADDRRYYSIPE